MGTNDGELQQYDMIVVVKIFHGRVRRVIQIRSGAAEDRINFTFCASVSDIVGGDGRNATRANEIPSECDLNLYMGGDVGYGKPEHHALKRVMGSDAERWPSTTQMRHVMKMHEFCLLDLKFAFDRSKLNPNQLFRTEVIRVSAAKWESRVNANPRKGRGTVANRCSQPLNPRICSSKVIKVLGVVQNIKRAGTGTLGGGGAIIDGIDGAARQEGSAKFSRGADGLNGSDAGTGKMGRGGRDD
ncbi:hypothetical protein C8R44DRAFT_751972 [Mycena epipterygia]|nr:hypothetical protein C8R44DRAFT_751972 [Mycena epipterygia]